MPLATLSVPFDAACSLCLLHPALKVQPWGSVCLQELRSFQATPHAGRVLQVEAYRTWVKQYREFNAETQRRMNQAAGLLAGSSSSTGLAGQQLQYA